MDEIKFVPYTILYFKILTSIMLFAYGMSKLGSWFVGDDAMLQHPIFALFMVGSIVMFFRWLSPDYETVDVSPVNKLIKWVFKAPQKRIEGTNVGKHITA